MMADLKDKKYYSRKSNIHLKEERDIKIRNMRAYLGSEERHVSSVSKCLLKLIKLNIF